MTTTTAVRPRALPLALALCVAYLAPASKLWSAPVTSPVGSYGILLNQWPSSNTGNDKTSALLGVLNFADGGIVTATYTKVNSDYSVKTGEATGTTSPNADGSSTVNLTFDDGALWTLAAVVTDKGSGLLITVTGGDPMNAFNGNPNPAEVWSGTGRLAATQGSLPAGSYGYVLNGWPDAGNKPSILSGILNTDGAGNLTGSYTLLNGRPTAFPGTVTGMYTVNPDGSGSMTLNLDLGITGTAAIIATEDGSGILMLGSVGAQVLAGTARLQ